MSNSLSLCVICKNEEDSIGTLLESVKGNLFDEIVVVDTGSTDKTLEILKKYNVKIEHFKWINDFSAARNYSFSKATSDYVMWMDSDDYLKKQDYEKLLKLKESLHSYPMWLFKYEYAHDEFGKSICSFFRERIIKRDLNLKWEQPIHEYIPLFFPYKQEDIEIHHNKKDAHTKRNVSILEEIVSKEPNFARNIYYLGKEYFDSGDTDKGINLLERFIGMPDAWGENKYGALIRLAENCISNKDNIKAKDYLFQSIRIDPLKAKAYYYLGDIALGEKDFHTAIHWFKVCTNTGRSEKSLDIVEPKYHTWLPYLQLCIAYNSIGDVREAARSNECALSFRPEDARMLSNKNIFLRSLKEDYPFNDNDSYANYHSYKIELNSLNKRMGWFTSKDSSFASSRIRMQNINDTLKGLGYQSEYFEYANENKYDFIITSSIYNSDHIEQIQLWKSKGITVLADINEDLLEFNNVKETLLAVDHIVCCSDSLKTHIEKTLGLTNLTVIEDAVEYYTGGSDGF